MSLSSRNWLQEDHEGSDVERRDIVAASGVDDASQDVGAGDDLARLDGGAGFPAQEEPVAVRAPARADRAPVRDDGSPLSRDLIELYFRQMGDVELLSRAQEMALAKRIEAGQRAMVEGLCRVPVLIERIALWLNELREGRLSVRNLIEVSAAADGLADTATEQQRSMAEDQNQPSGYADREVKLPLETMRRLERIAALAREIASLKSQKRMSTLARGRNPAGRDRVQLDDLLTRAAREVDRLKLHPDRTADLVSTLEHEHRQLGRIEQQVALERNDAITVAKVRRELSALAQRVGLPIEEFRAVAAQVCQAQRDVRSAREEW
jgi:RNA polymerase primary sigma factor